MPLKSWKMCIRDRKSDDEIAELFAPIVANNGVDESLERITQLVHMMKDRVDFVKELRPLCSFFFVAPLEYDPKTVRKRWKDYSVQQMTELAALLESLDDFSLENQEEKVMNWVEDKGYKLGDVMNAFRLTLVGIGKGPGMFDISAFLGKEETLKRLQDVYKRQAYCTPMVQRAGMSLGVFTPCLNMPVSSRFVLF